MEPAKNVEAVMVPVEGIATDMNVRRKGDAELAASIEARGLLQPIVVARKPGGGYTVVAGRRRLEAVKKLGWTEVPAVIYEGADGDLIAASLAENADRKDLTAAEEAKAYDALIHAGWEVDDVARQYGRSDRYVADRLALLTLPAATLKALTEARAPVGVGLILLRVPDGDKQLAIVKDYAEHGSRGIRDVVRELTYSYGARRKISGAEIPQPLRGKATTCAECPSKKRGGTMPSLFGDGLGIDVAKHEAEDETWTCYDAKCFKATVDRLHDEIQKRLAEKGMKPVKDPHKQTAYENAAALKDPECKTCGDRGYELNDRRDVGYQVFCCNQTCYKAKLTADRRASKSAEKAAGKKKAAKPDKEPKALLWPDTTRRNVHVFERGWLEAAIVAKAGEAPAVKGAQRVGLAAVVTAAAARALSSLDQYACTIVPEYVVGKYFKGMPEKFMDDALAMNAKTAAAYYADVLRSCLERAPTRWIYALGEALGINREKGYKLTPEFLEGCSFNKRQLLAMAKELDGGPEQMEGLKKRAEYVERLCEIWPDGHLPKVVADDWRANGKSKEK